MVSPLCLSFTVTPFIFSSLPFFSLPPLKATDHHSPKSTTVIAAMFDIMCQNRPHCLLSPSYIFFLFFPPPPPLPASFLGDSAVPNSSMNVQRPLLLTNDRCKQPLWEGWLISRQTSRLYPHLNLRVAVCVLRMHSWFCDVILPIVPLCSLGGEIQTLFNIKLVNAKCWFPTVADSGCLRGRGEKNKKGTSCGAPGSDRAP